MGAIYGYWLKKDVEDSMGLRFRALDIWTQEYGKDIKKSKKLHNVLLGCNQSKIRTDVKYDDNVINYDKRYYGVCDAIIYNREELISRLSLNQIDFKLQDLRTISDEKLLFLIWIRWGGEGLKSVNGDFAGAVYDSHQKTLTVFRDHLGIRPLFLYEDENIWAFSTDYRALLAMPDTDCSVCEEYLYSKIALYNIRDVELTDFQYVKALAPAQVLVYDIVSGTMSKSRYWKLGGKKIRFSSEKDYIDEMRRLVKDSITKRLAVSTQVIGGELSGGLDSTVIDVLIHKTGREACFCSWTPCVDKVPMQCLDERKNIEVSCKNHGFLCHHLDMAWYDNEDYIVAAMERISPIEGAFSSIDESMKFFHEKGVQIAFSGWGGDEGVSHRANPLELWLHKEYLSYLKLWWERTEGESNRLLRFTKRVLKNLLFERKERLGNKVYQFEYGKQNEDFLNTRFSERIKKEIQTVPVYFAFDAIKQIEMGGNRQRLESVAYYGSVYDIQYVFPYLDYRVEDFAVSIPRALYLKKNKNRYIYREAFKKELTKELYEYQYKDDPGRGRFVCENIDKRFKVVYKYAMEHLDREYWSKYLDFETIEKSVDFENLKNMEFIRKSNILMILNRCCRIQNIQKRLKETTKGLMID